MRGSLFVLFLCLVTLGDLFRHFRNTMWAILLSFTINWSNKSHSLFEPSHEIVLRKLILQTRMRSHLVGLYVWFLVGPFVFFHTSCVRTAKALARLRGCAGSQEPSLVAYVKSTIISWDSSLRFDVKKKSSWIKLHRVCQEIHIQLFVCSWTSFTHCLLSGRSDGVRKLEFPSNVHGSYEISCNHGAPAY